MYFPLFPKTQITIMMILQSPNLASSLKRKTATKTVLLSAAIFSCRMLGVRSTSVPFSNGIFRERTHGNEHEHEHIHRRLPLFKDPNIVLALFGHDYDCLEDLPFVFKDEEMDEFSLTSYYESPKDLNSYYIRDDEGPNVDYTDLLEALKAPCEYYGGALFSVSASQTCRDSASARANADLKTFHVKNLPYCAMEGCNVNQATVEEYGNSNEWNYCEGPVERHPVTYEVKELAENSSILSEACRTQLKTLSMDDPSPLLTSNRFKIDDFDMAGDGSKYDYNAALKNFTIPCEAQGGYLYKFSEKITGNELSMYDEGGITFLNYPVCLASSCNAKEYFEKVFVPTSKFELEGKFRHKDFGFLGDGSFQVPSNETYPARQYYTFLGFGAVSDIPSFSRTKTDSSFLVGVCFAVAVLGLGWIGKNKIDQRKSNRVGNVDMLKDLELL